MADDPHPAPIPGLDPFELRIALVQIECHPDLVFEELDYAAEPFMVADGEPVLSSLISKGFDLSDVREEFRTKYRDWHELRLQGIIRWFINTYPDHPRPDATETTKPLFQEEETAAQLKATTELNLSSMSGVVVIDAEGKINVRLKTKLSPFEMGKSGKPSLDGPVNPMPIRFAPRAPLCDRTMPHMIVFPEGAVPLKHLGLLQHFARETGTVIIAGTHVLERGEEANEIYKDLKAAFQDAAAAQVLEKKKEAATTSPADSHRPELQVLVAVCSEALQIPITEKPHHLLVIPSYHERTAQFNPIIDFTAANQVPVVYCNDGRFGGSTISTLRDHRNPSWWATQQKPDVLPTGDAILVMDVHIGRNAPQRGALNPMRPTELVNLAAIVPDDASSSEFRVAKELERLASKTSHDPFKDNEQIEARLVELDEHEQPTPLQRLNLRHLRELFQQPRVAYPHVWRVHANDCFYGRNAFRRQQEGTEQQEQLMLEWARTPLDGSERARGKPPVNLKRLEDELARRLFHRISHLLDELDLTSVRADQLIRARRECARRFLRDSSPTVLGSVRKGMAQIAADAEDEAMKRLTHSLGRIVERFQATAGWLYLRSDPSPNVPKDPPAQQGFKLVVRVAHNAPTQYRELDNKSGVVGHVAATERGYVNNQIINWRGAPRDPYYIKALDATRSELCVPLLFWDIGKSANEPELLGVVNLESRDEGAFLPVDVGELQAVAATLVPDVLVVKTRREQPRHNAWHPHRHGWGLGRALEAFCFDIAKSLPTGTTDPAVGCTVWYVDREKQVLLARGTTGFDYEYIADRTLPFGSFTGETVNRYEAAPETVHTLRIRSTAPSPFLRRDKARRMEVRKIKSVAIRRPRGSATIVPSPWFIRGNHREPLGVFNLYFYEGRQDIEIADVDKAFGDMVVLRLADYAGAFVHDFAVLRSKVAGAVLRARLQEDGLLGTSLFETMKDALVDILEADGSSIFVRYEPGPDEIQILVKHDVGTVYCIATTGLLFKERKRGSLASVSVRRERGRPRDPFYTVHFHADATDDAPFYKFMGLAQFLVDHPGAAIRKLSVIDSMEEVYPDYEDVASHCATIRLLEDDEQKGKEIEVLAAHQLGDHRYLGVSLCDADSKRSNIVAPLGMIRLVRRRSARPFVVADQVLLSRLADNICKKAFEMFVSHRAFDKHERNVEFCERWIKLITSARWTTGPVPNTSEIRRAVRQIMRPASAYVVWNRLSIEGFLQDLLESLKSWGAHLADLRIAVRHEDGREELRLYALRSFGSSEPPEEHDEYPAVKEPDSIGRRAVRSGCIITFDREGCGLFKPISPESQYVMHGIDVPVRVLANGYNVDAVLSVDFRYTGDRAPNGERQARLLWDAQWVAFFAHAVRRLSWMASDNTSVPDVIHRPTVRPPEAALHKFIQDLRDEFDPDGKAERFWRDRSRNGRWWKVRILRVSLVTQYNSARSTLKEVARAVDIEAADNMRALDILGPDNATWDNRRDTPSDPELAAYGALYKWWSDKVPDFTAAPGVDLEAFYAATFRLPLYCGAAAAAVVEGWLRLEPKGMEMRLERYRDTKAQSAGERDEQGKREEAMLCPKALRERDAAWLLSRITEHWNAFANDANGIQTLWDVKCEQRPAPEPPAKWQVWEAYAEWPWPYPNAAIQI